MSFDVVVKAGLVVSGERAVRADIGIADGRIAAIEPELDAPAQETIEAEGLVVLPGPVDAHVHLNDPGRASWEGFESGTRALAAGGSTTAIDMPLNSIPATVRADALAAKLRTASGRAYVDFALWGGLVPGNVEHLPELAALGVVGFKAFMPTTGIDDFIACDDVTLLEGMMQAAELRLPVAVHAESDAITTVLTARARALGGRGVTEFLASRPVIAEVEAVARAVALAEASGCSLHVVHVSSARALAEVLAGRARGVDVTCETCPHYLVFDEESLEQLGALAKCTPPLRPAADVDALWSALVDGRLPMVASDHSPAPLSLKRADDFFDVWGGISGCQLLLTLMISEGVHRRGLTLERLAEVTARYPARRFRLPGKGEIAIDADADLVLVDLDASRRIELDELLVRHPDVCPYVDSTVRGQVRRTILRGVTIYRDATLIAPARGRHVRSGPPPTSREPEVDDG
ncbi:MAG: allantoinase AllB [Solirubrobacteraceae bacterium]